jgi:hypothetical protein
MAELKKVDRKKIYGWSTIEVFDDNGSKCKLAGLAEGQFVMPSSSTALVSLNSKGETVSKDTIEPARLFNPSCPKCSSRMKRHKQCGGTGCDSHGGCTNGLRDKSNGMRCRACSGAIYIGDTEDLNK